MRARQPLSHLLTTPLADIATLRVHDKLRLAASPRTPQAVLDLLVRDPRVEVRIALTRRARASDAVLRELALDPVPAVRERLAHRVPLPRDVVATLLADSSGIVRSTVLLRRRLPVGSGDAESTSEAERRLALASDGLAPELARRLARDSDWSVRRLALFHARGPAWFETVALAALAPELEQDLTTRWLVARLLDELSTETPSDLVPAGAISALMRNPSPEWRGMGRELAYHRHAARSRCVMQAPNCTGAPIPLDGTEKQPADDARPAGSGGQPLRHGILEHE